MVGEVPNQILCSCAMNVGVVAYHKCVRFPFQCTHLPMFDMKEDVRVIIVHFTQFAALTIFH